MSNTGSITESVVNFAVGVDKYARKIEEVQKKGNINLKLETGIPNINQPGYY
ncbi:hypothetical protein RDn1_262 [Candidatus Termititenax dinenymphae]|uniref:Uncharacterized protein n=1 Tax=Candidatus Termititenax dinenymphae TaxID=2218523 RepID=A0A388TJX6_9BACT|nr:hypothetical protein RDn1_262 [Candidatus Termititenax dinenymphae]